MILRHSRRRIDRRSAKTSGVLRQSARFPGSPPRRCVNGQTQFPTAAESWGASMAAAPSVWTSRARVDRRVRRESETSGLPVKVRIVWFGVPTAEAVMRERAFWRVFF